MCVVSMIGDGYQDQFPGRWPTVVPYYPDEQPANPGVIPFTLTGLVSQKEFDELKKEVEELKKVLAAAQKFDTQTSQPHCDSPDKLKLIRWLAKELGVDLSDLKLNE
jgi:hypothetical protein